ncbi:MAG: hypothetical protein R6U96_08425 [Promethearchaeia archaeon]
MVNDIGDILLIVGISAEILILFVLFKLRRPRHRYKKILNASKKDLKEYTMSYILTNERAIVKDVTKLKDAKIYAENNSISSIKFQKDYIFLYLKDIKEILVVEQLRQINFLLEKSTKASYIQFKFDKEEKGRSEMNEVVSVLKKNFILKKKVWEKGIEMRYSLYLSKKSLEDPDMEEEPAIFENRYAKLSSILKISRSFFYFILFFAIILLIIYFYLLL